MTRNYYHSSLQVYGLGQQIYFTKWPTPLQLVFIDPSIAQFLANHYNEIVLPQLGLSSEIEDNEIAHFQLYHYNKIVLTSVVLSF